MSLREPRDPVKKGVLFTLTVVGVSGVIIAALCGALILLSGIGMVIVPANTP